MSELTKGDWRCDVCKRNRPYEKLAVASHHVTDANGVTVTQNVKYCTDNDTCERHARVRNLTDLAYRRLTHERDALQSALMDVHEKLVWQRGFWALAAFVAGFVIRGAI